MNYFESTPQISSRIGTLSNLCRRFRILIWTRKVLDSLLKVTYLVHIFHFLRSFDIIPHGCLERLRYLGTENFVTVPVPYLFFLWLTKEITTVLTILHFGLLRKKKSKVPFKKGREHWLSVLQLNCEFVIGNCFQVRWWPPAVCGTRWSR